MRVKASGSHRGLIVSLLETQGLVGSLMLIPATKNLINSFHVFCSADGASEEVCAKWRV